MITTIRSKGSNTPVLSPVDSVSNPENTFFPTGKEAFPSQAEREQEVRRLRIVSVNKVLASLLAGLSPADHQLVHNYLEHPSAAASAMLDAWARCGRGDGARQPSIDMTRTAKATLTPLGVACLVRYARAWVDAAEASLMVAASDAS